MILDGKIALVTGAGRGVGRAHAIALAAAGAHVIVNDLGGTPSGDGNDASPAQQVCDAIQASGGKAAADGSDISSWQQAKALIDGIIERHGRIDIIVNNAGICRPTAFGELSEHDWDRTLDVNAKGMAALIDAAARHWRVQGSAPGRAIVNTASGGGTHPIFPLGLYGVSKAAVLALTQVAAEELAPLGVRVNGLAPVARTRMVFAAMAGRPVDPARIMPSDPAYDLYDPDHIARLALYLVSTLCRFTGRIFSARADDIYIYKEWDAVYHIDNKQKPWTLQALAAAIAALPGQEQINLVGPMGRHTVPWPSDDTLTKLAGVKAIA